jgi:hypothetical protein
MPLEAFAKIFSLRPLRLCVKKIFCQQWQHCDKPAQNQREISAK